MENNVSNAKVNFAAWLIEVNNSKHLKSTAEIKSAQRDLAWFWSGSDGFSFSSEELEFGGVNKTFFFIKSP